VVVAKNFVKFNSNSVGILGVFGTVFEGGINGKLSESDLFMIINSGVSLMCPGHEIVYTEIDLSCESVLMINLQMG